MYVKTLEKIACIYPYSINDLRIDNPHTSFPSAINNEMLAAYGVYPVTIQQNPIYDTATQYVETQNLPSLVDGVWVIEKIVVNMTLEQIQAREDGFKKQNKVKAAQLLQQTDWTSIPAVSDPDQSDPYLTNAAEFASYRSKLRQIAIEPPSTVVEWPAAPKSDWIYKT
jgi:hypothetical protein